MADSPCKRILIVEDDEDNRKILTYRLRRLEGVELSEAANGLEAVERAAAEAPDLIIMDIHMPVMNGFEAAERIRMLAGPTGRVPIIALTAEELSRAASTGDTSAVSDYIQKPIVDPETLNAKVLFWLGRDHGEPVQTRPAAVGLTT
jgi:CheY-like chemotaxis protein